jgi:hypothetical protein
MGRQSQIRIVAAQALSVVSFTALNWQRAWSLAPVTLLYVSNVAFALMGLQNLNIPMYNTLKRLTPVIVLVTRVRHFFQILRRPFACSGRGPEKYLEVLSQCRVPCYQHMQFYS